MTRSWAQALPSAGVWLILASWALAGALVAWGAGEPRLDRMRRELDALAVRGGDTASDWLVAELERELPRRPRLVTKLAGETGARALEARRDGTVTSRRFHVALNPAVKALAVSGPTPMELELRRGSELVKVAVAPTRVTQVELPAAWRGQPLLLEVAMLGAGGEVLVTGAGVEAGP